MKLVDLEVGKLFSFAGADQREGKLFLKLYFTGMKSDAIPVYDLAYHQVITMGNDVTGIMERPDRQMVVTMDQGEGEYGPKFKQLKDVEAGTAFEYLCNTYILVDTPGSQYQREAKVCAIKIDGGYDREGVFGLCHINRDFMVTTGEVKLYPMDLQDGMNKLAKAMEKRVDEMRGSGARTVCHDDWLDATREIAEWMGGSCEVSKRSEDGEDMKGCKDDNVNHPAHYQSKNGIEVIDVIEAFTENLTGIQAVCAGNALKYLCRWSKKNGLEDLEKAEWYLRKLKISLKAEKMGEFLEETT